MKLSYLFVFLIGCGWGHVTLSQSWDGRVFFKAEKGPRKPAAFDQAMDLTKLEGYRLEMAQKKQLIAVHKVEARGKEISIQFGNFVYQPREGQTSFVCDEYDEIKLLFAAEGMAVSGSKPLMQITSKCLIDGDRTYLSPIYIPVNKILSTRATDQSFDYYTKYNAEIKFSNVSMVWPQSWSLEEVKIYNSHTLDAGITIDKTEILEINIQPIVINW